MLSKKQSADFLRTMTGNSNVFTPYPSEDNVKILNDVILNFHQRIPFQNITLLAKPVGTQDIPTLEEIFSDVIAQRGGLCYTNNVFMKYFLCAFGLKASHIAATCNLKHPNNHILTKVEGLTESENLYLAEVGCGYPTYKAIDLSPSNTDHLYTAGFLKYKFINNGDRYERYHFQDFETDNKLRENNTWERYYTFTLEQRKLDYFKTSMEEVYRDRFLKKIRVLVFKGEDMHVLKESGSSVVKLIITPSGTSKVMLDSTEEIVSAIKHLLPVVQLDTIREAVCNWKHFTETKVSE